ncbi:hypothetical protein RHO14_03395 [Orbus wheelerorum]|uniref:hypothetical protein n=1 Tax=Orbus wheelerorum TaxID=3074111 RepID=UPI00370D28BE
MIEKQIYNTLAELCDGHVYPLVADENTYAPYIVYTPISNVKTDTFCGTAETTSSIQVDVYHQIYDELLILKDNIITKLEQLPIFNINWAQSYEVDTKLYRVMIEISIIN